MIDKERLLQELHGLLEMEQELRALCLRQTGSLAFFSSIPLANRPDVSAGLEAFLARSQQYLQTFKELISIIQQEERDVY
jgi:hypothetical protein